MTIKGKLYLLSGLTAGLLVVVAAAMWCLAEFRVSGPVYQQIVANKDLTADILPPPLYIVESYVALHEAEEARTPEELAAIEARLARLEQQYEPRYEHWRQTMPATNADLDASRGPAIEMFRLVREEFLPALHRGDKAAASQLLSGSIRAAYQGHRAAIDRAVAHIATNTRRLETAATRQVRTWTDSMILLAIGAAALLALVTFSLTRNIVLSTRALIERVEQIAGGSADLTARVRVSTDDELGRLAAGINLTIEKIATLVKRMEEAEASAHHLRHLLRNIIDSMPSALVAVDTDAKVMQWNHEAERLTGVPGDQALGREIGHVMPDLLSRLHMISRAVRDRAVQAELRVPIHTSAGERMSDVTIYPLIANGVAGAVVRIDDRSGRAQMEEMVVTSEKMRTVAGLAAGIAHEINNPLAGILGHAQVILNRVALSARANQEAAAECGVSLEGVHAYLEKREIPQMLRMIHEAGAFAAQVIDNMLSFSRRARIQMAPQKLEEVIDKSVELISSDFDLSRRYDFQSVTIERCFDPELPAIPCRASELQQVLMNLMKNAAQAMLDNRGSGRTPRLTLRTRRDHDEAVIEVEDNGPGIPEQVRRNLFEPFVTTRVTQAGTGLGLFVAYLIVTQNHGGRIEAASRPEGGTRFIIRLPITQDALRSDEAE